LDLVVRLLAGAGLALPCGLSAYIPLLVLGVAGVGKKTTVYAPFDFVATWPFIAVIALLVGIDVFLDKLPSVQRFNNLLNQVTRPLAGGIACAAVISPDLLSPVISFIIGAVLAEAMHLMKTGLRPALANSGQMARIFEPLISVGEDGLAVVLAILALALPVAAGPIAILVLIGGWLWVTSLRRKQTTVNSIDKKVKV
jgi:hypothetical protein